MSLVLVTKDSPKVLTLTVKTVRMYLLLEMFLQMQEVIYYNKIYRNKFKNDVEAKSYESAKDNFCAQMNLFNVNVWVEGSSLVVFAK